MNSTLPKSALFCAAVAMAATPALAEKANELTYLNGSDAGSAERQLRDRGFAHIGSDRHEMSFVYSYWWDEGDDDCVQVEARNGRVMTINDASDQDCGHHKGNAGAAVAAVAGAAILGALLSHKSHHHEDGNHHSDRDSEMQYERGYKDGLHNAACHNYDRSDSYSSGYSAGVQQRNANLSHHHGQGYRQAAQFKDRRDARCGRRDDPARAPRFPPSGQFHQQQHALFDPVAATVSPVRAGHHRRRPVLRYPRY